MIICTFDDWDRANIEPEPIDYPHPHRATLRTIDDLWEPMATGNEHALIFAAYSYATDDEDLTDIDELDLLQRRWA